MALRLKFTLNPHTGREDLRFNGDHQGVWIEPKRSGYLVRLCEPPDLYPYSWGKFHIRREVYCADIQGVARIISNSGDDLLLAMATLMDMGLLEALGEEIGNE